MGKLSWTSFYLVCLENKDQVRRHDVKSKFRVVARIDGHGVSKSNIRHLNQHGYFHRVPCARSRDEMEVRIDHAPSHQPTKLFKPVIVEVIGAGFDKPADARYFTLRFPRIQKVHEDRSYEDVISFDELQELTSRSRLLEGDELEQVEKDWLAKLQMTERSV
jgi:DNA ligase 4